MQNIKKPTKKKVECFGIKLIISSLSCKDEKVLNSIGINAKSCMTGLLSIDLYTSSGYESGIGMATVNRGFEFLNKKTMQQHFGLIRSGHVFIEGRSHKALRDCCVFYDMHDYLAYLAINQSSPLYLPRDADCFILCEARNYFDLAIDTDEYVNIYTFFPNTDFGKSLMMTLRSRNPGHVLNCDVYYGGYKTLHDYYQDLNTRPAT